MYEANVLKVMIASPSDVRRERQEVRGILHDWNAVNSEQYGLVLMPVGWDSHAAPELGTRPQEIINRSVLADCDLLVAMFWTRLGTPTGVAESGTAEEIEEHVAAGKHAMLYFSDAPAAPSTIDPEQHKALLAFKGRMEQEGLIETYSDPDDFAGKFRHQLGLTIPRKFEGHRSARGGEVELGSSSSNDLRELDLSAEARTLLLQAAEDTHGSVLKVRSMAGTGILTNGQELNTVGDRRSEAKWEAALEELLSIGALEARGYKGEVFAMTHVGYMLADHLRKRG